MKNKDDLPLYRLDIVRSLLFSVIAFAADIYAIPAILRNKKTLSKKELAAIDPEMVTGIDRFAIKQDPAQREPYRKVSDNLLRGVIGLAAILFFDKKLCARKGRILALYTEMHAITYTIYSYSPLGPAFQDKYRPVVYYTELPDDARNKSNNRNSRYSGHTGNAAAASFFCAKVFLDHHPETSIRAKALVYSLALIPPLLVGMLRIKALKHFPSDIALAILIGAICGIGIPELHRAHSERR